MPPPQASNRNVCKKTSKSKVTKQKQKKKMVAKNKKKVPPPPLATDITAPRLRGCTYIQTEVPPVLLPPVPIPNRRRGAQQEVAEATTPNFKFLTAFLTAHHLYAFYKQSTAAAADDDDDDDDDDEDENDEEDDANNGLIRLGRFCRFSHTWQAVEGFPALRQPPARWTGNNSCRLEALPLPWAQGPEGGTNHREVLLFYADHCALLTLTAAAGADQGGGGGGGGGGALAPVATTLEQLSLLSMLSFPEGVVVNVDLTTLSVNWLAVVAWPERRAVFALARISLDQRGTPDLGLFRLDFLADGGHRWRQLTLVERPADGHRLSERGHFMALHDGHLYIGLVVRREVQLPEEYPESRENELSGSLEEVLVINLESLEVERRPVGGDHRPSPATANLQVNLQFAQVGDTVYALNALLGPEPRTGRGAALHRPRLLVVVKNQLWALHLPSLTMRQINDGLPSTGTSSASSVSSFSPEDFFVPTLPLEPLHPFHFLVRFDSRNVDSFISLCYDPYWPSKLGEIFDTASPMLMSHFELVSDHHHGGNELWALSLGPPQLTRQGQQQQQQQQPPQLPPRRLCHLYRVALGPEVTSLASLALRSMLTSGRPVRGLVEEEGAQEEAPPPPTDDGTARFGGRLRPRAVPRPRPRLVPQQERTLPYLRAFVQGSPYLRSIAERHLPAEEPREVRPIQELQ